jgi:hypothetical protein
MNMKVNALLKTKSRILWLPAFACLLTAFSLIGWRWLNVADTDLTTPVSAQTDAMLDRRISQVEQRFYYIESRLNNLESQSRYPGIVPGSTSANQNQISQLRTEVDTLRTQIDSLRSRVGEVECGLLKVDERTLTLAARQSRRQSAAGSSEPCRADTSTPIKLSARP